MEFDSLFIAGLISVAPGFLFWMVVIIIGSVMLNHDGGKAEHYIVIGASFMLVRNLLTIPSAAIVPWLMHNEYSITQATSLVSGYRIFSDIIGMAGTICFIYAFWLKFKVKRQQKIYE